MSVKTSYPIQYLKVPSLDLEKCLGSVWRGLTRIKVAYDKGFEEEVIKESIRITLVKIKSIKENMDLGQKVGKTLDAIVVVLSSSNKVFPKELLPLGIELQSFINPRPKNQEDGLEFRLLLHKYNSLKQDLQNDIPFQDLQNTFLEIREQAERLNHHPMLKNNIKNLIQELQQETS